MSNTPLTPQDRPASYIGRSVPRPNARRLLEGRGTFTDDLQLPRTVHAAFVRSPHAHARITSIDARAALGMAGVLRVVDGAEMARWCSPWTGVLSHLAGMKSAPQHALAVERALWQGEPVVAVVARSRAEAEDAAERVEVDYEPLAPLVDAERALDPGTPVLHAELGDNLVFERRVDAGDVDRALAGADRVIERTFRFARHTGVTLEPRSVLADFDPAERRLTVYLSTQAPHMMKHIFARHLALDEDAVRVVCRDVGGSFGIKIHVYGDEMACAALAVMLRRPVKFVADRLESFVSDIHARDHRVHARMGVTAAGDITALDIDDLTGIGPFSVYPRTSGIEANQIVNLTGAPYVIDSYRAGARVVVQNKNVMCQYRAVGHPIACAVAEGLVDAAARELALDPAELRRRNLVPDDAYPHRSASGVPFEKLSHQQSLRRLLEHMDYDALRAEQARLRARGVHRGIGLAAMVEVTNPSPAFYGAGGAHISAQEGCTIRLDPTGGLTCSIGVTEQGQGAESVVAQVAATAVGVPLERVRVLTGDTDVVPYGGGTWASRAAGIGGEATWQAGKALREEILALAATILQVAPTALDVRAGEVVERDGGAARLSLAELAELVYFRGDTLPAGRQPELVATRHYVPRAYPFTFTNGIEAALVEVDVEAGLVALRRFWVVEDCGTVINPQLVDEQIRGGVVQGIGAALYEQCLYDEQGQMLNGTLADYLVPMAGEMPDIDVIHVSTPTADSELGAKGAGEAGTAGAVAAVMNAVNDALAPLGAEVTEVPITPERVLQALGAVPT